MKTSPLLLIFILFYTFCEPIFAQNNIVKKPGFENYVLCPSIDNLFSGGNMGILYFITNWEELRYDGSAINIYRQYGNSCSKSKSTDNIWFNNGIPKNTIGYQSAFEGNGYATLAFTNPQGIVKGEWRNFFGTSLSSVTFNIFL